jgi:PAS domain-containing protein
MMTMRPNRPIRYLILCGALLIAAIAVGTALLLSNFHNRALVDSERELKNTALILAEQIDRSFQALELVQGSVIERMHSLRIASSQDYAREMSGQDVHRMLKDKINGLVHVDAITLIDADGRLLNFSRAWPIPPINVADRDYFKALKADAQLTSFVSEPLRNRGTGTWTVYLARKLVTPQGEFLGLVLGAIELSYFEKLFGSIVLGDHSSISLHRRDGVLLARFPRIESAIGKSFTSAIDALGGRDSGTIRFIGKMEGKDRLLAAHRLAHYPLHIAVVLDTDAALARWQKETQVLLSAGALAAFAIALMIFLIVRQLWQGQKLATQRLALEKQRLDTAVNNMSQGLLLFDSCQRIVVCNRRYIEMYGLSSDVVKPGCHLRDLVRHRKETGSFPGDVDAYLADLLNTLAQGKTIERIAEAAYGRSVRIVNQPLTDGGWVATHQDITEQRKIEQERDQDREFLNQIIDNVPVMIAVKDAASRRFVLANRAEC